MEIIKTNCPECRQILEFPRDFDNVICSSCNSQFQVRQYKGVINLLPIEKPADLTAQDLSVIEARLAEIDEIIEEAGTEIEILRSREQSGPLQLGCAFFGLFMLGLTVIIGFMLLGRSYVGHWAFYLTLAATLLLGFVRTRRKLASRSQVEQFRQQRLQFENGLAELESERDRLLRLKEIIASHDRASNN
jgi:LSD1 subclass zinc finger protein